MTDEETFTVNIRRFERDGKRLAVIEMKSPGETFPYASTSYCNDEEIINKAFRNAYTAVSREINTAGLPEPARKRNA